MTIAECKHFFGDNADDMCKTICGFCNEGYCPDDCGFVEWVRTHYDKAVERLAEVDGDLVKMSTRYKTWK